MEIPVLKDITQHKEKLKIPEIRVWCHPHKIGEDGEDYFYSFDNFQEALLFISGHKEAEDAPLLAFDGYEINIFAISEKDIKRKYGRSYVFSEESENKTSI